MSEEIQATRSREEFFQGFLDHLTIPFLKPIAEGFFENVRQVESLIQMPMMMFVMVEWIPRSTAVFVLLRWTIEASRS